MIHISLFWDSYFPPHYYYKIIVEKSKFILVMMIGLS